jgi:hypothetical protein
MALGIPPPIEEVRLNQEQFVNRLWSPNKARPPGTLENMPRSKEQLHETLGTFLQPQSLHPLLQLGSLVRDQRG